jgi:predicted Zn-dependent peptidase
MIRSNKYLFVTSICLVFLFFCPRHLLAYELAKRVQSHTLKNGLRLLMVERHLSPTISLYIRHRAGAVDEADGKTGTAHLLEHMMFKGTRTIGTRNYRLERKILSKIEEVGVAIDREKMKGKAADEANLARLTSQLTALQKGQRRLTISNEIDRLYTEQGAVGLNASTSQDLTTYQVSIPANRIELWARIESDRMAHPVFREFFTERDVVMEERRQRSESDPDGKLLESYFAAAYIAHPYRRPILGWPSDMHFLDLAYLKKFFRKSHTPSDTVIAIVGDIRPAETIKLVEKYFGWIPSETVPTVPAIEEPVQSGEKRIEVVFAAEPKMILGYRKPPPPAPVDHVFDVIESLLTRGRTSRLFKTLVEERHLADNIQAINGMPGVRYQNQFTLFATPRHPHTCLDLELAIDAEIARIKSEPVSDRELAKVKNQIRVDFIRGLDSNAGLAGMLSYYEALLGDYRYITTYTDVIDKITPDDVMLAARTYLVRENRTIATLIKKN